MANYVKIIDYINSLIQRGKPLKYLPNSNISFTHSHSNIAPNFDVNDLYVNLDCQREITDGRAKKIMQITKRFNANQFSVPQITQTMCGKYVVPDGLGRTISAILNGVNRIPGQLLVKSNPNQSDDDWQGELYLSQDENEESLKGWQRHRVAKNLQNPQSKAMKYQHSRAQDIQRVIDKLNTNSKGIIFGYEGNNNDVDLSEAYRYFANGVFREEYNPNYAKLPAGTRDAPELFEACIAYQQYGEKEVMGQNLEAFYSFIADQAQTTFNNNSSMTKLDSIKEAGRQLRFILHTKAKTSKKQQLSNQELKNFLGTTNCANNQVSKVGTASLNQEWKKLRNNTNYMAQYATFP